MSPPTVTHGRQDKAEDAHLVSDLPHLLPEALPPSSTTTSTTGTHETSPGETGSPSVSVSVSGTNADPVSNQYSTSPSSQPTWRKDCLPLLPSSLDWLKDRVDPTKPTTCPIYIMELHRDLPVLQDTMKDHPDLPWSQIREFRLVLDDDARAYAEDRASEEFLKAWDEAEDANQALFEKDHVANVAKAHKSEEGHCRCSKSPQEARPGFPIKLTIPAETFKHSRLLEAVAMSSPNHLVLDYSEMTEDDVEPDIIGRGLQPHWPASSLANFKSHFYDLSIRLPGDLSLLSTQKWEPTYKDHLPEGEAHWTRYHWIFTSPKSTPDSASTSVSDDEKDSQDRSASQYCETDLQIAAEFLGKAAIRTIQERPRYDRFQVWNTNAAFPGLSDNDMRKKIRSQMEKCTTLDR